ncbi:MAG: bifunctional glutamate N-acetyltransferase/amino-acid acetyltransferase ArgJ [Chitinispirillaceae bacterium]
MDNNTQSIVRINGGVTAARGFMAGGYQAGIKTSGKSDLGILFSEAACTAAGTFTQNTLRAACVDWNSNLLPSDSIHAVCCNSGNANACTGEQGVLDVRSTAEETALLLNTSPDSILVSSTGCIGEFLPMQKLKSGLVPLASSLSTQGGNSFAKAIMTTDTIEKESAVSVRFESGTAIIGGCAKGSGMICPNMATMLCFISTDAAIKASTLQAITSRVVDFTFNNLTVDGDTSTNDMVLVLSNGLSAVQVESASDISLFQDALFEVCNSLCAKIAEDGEGATKRIEVNVTGGKNDQDCKLAAKAIANSNLVKTAIFGNDPNWGRILCAIGYSGAQFSSENLRVSLCGMPVCHNLRPVAFPHEQMLKRLKEKIVIIDVDLGTGGQTCAVAHTCDLTYDYVRINAEYHT